MTNDERRERYEAAIGAEDIQNIYVIRAAARAAMAVANREQQELNAESSNASRYLFERDAAQDEIARLRAELSKIRDAANKARESWNDGDIDALISAAREGETP